MSISVLMDKDTLKGQSIRIADQESSVYTFLITEGTDISLPFPINIISTASPQWEGNDRSMTSQVAEAAMEGSAVDTIKSWGGEMANIINGTMKHSVGSSGMLGAAFLGKEQILHKSGKAINPFKQLMFSGMDFRTFDLQFDIVPKSAHEAEQLKEAVKALQYHAVPEILDAAGGLFMEYPDSWDVSFQPDNSYLPAFLPSVLTNVVVDYAGLAGQVIFKDNYSPVSISLTLSFSETEIFTKANAEYFYG